MVTIHTHTHIYVHFKRRSVTSLLIEYSALIFIVRPNLILLFRYSIYIMTFLCFFLSVVEKGGRTHNPLWLWARLFLSLLLLICFTCLAAMLLDALRFRIADFPAGPVVKNPPVNSGNMGLIPGLGRFYMLWGDLSLQATAVESTCSSC